MKLQQILLTVIFSFAISAFAQQTDAPEQKKYCGSGFTERLVPEAPFGCQMSNACKAHDMCYSKCDEGGTLFGQPYCTKSEFSSIRLEAKLACESDFYNNIARDNNGRWVCKGLGAVYVAAVAVAGQGPFNGLPMQRASIEDLIMTSNTIEEIKSKTTTISVLSQKGEIDLHQIRRVQDRIEFSPILNKGTIATPKFEFPKGFDLEELKKLQARKLGE
jgi:hypothetical protein